MNDENKPEFELSSGKDADSRKESTESSRRSHGRVLAENMSEGGYHPVIIFGTSHSGKSSLLGSLLKCFQVEGSHGVGISFGESLLPEGTSHGKDAVQLAESLFYRSQQEYIDGQGHEATRIQFPFFVPVILRPNNRPPVKFALMESNGESYQPDRGSGRFFQQLKQEVEAVLTHYEKGISFIYLAPYTQSRSQGDAMTMDQDRAQINDAGLALVGVMDAYEKLRKDKHDDMHMMLVTKWDASKSNESDLADVLGAPDPGEIEAFAISKYRQAFAAFKGLSLRGDQRSLMQYCSGLFNGREIRKPPDELVPTLDRYPLVLWNWLYANASDGGVLVPQKQPPKENVLQMMLRWIKKILQ